MAGTTASDIDYINDYINTSHRGKMVCSMTEEKGRILTSEAAFRLGDVIFREPPLLIVAEQRTNSAFERLKRLCKEKKEEFEYEPLWYWAALCSLVPRQVGDKAPLASITEDQQRKLLLLYHPDVTEASDAAKVLVNSLNLAGLLEPLALETLLQVWILNCFEHSDDPLGYSTYFMSSFMSHSCLPNAVWHYEDDDFVLRARRDISAGDEISVSYLSEDSLLESAPVRRKYLEDSKHFVCCCDRCSASRDFSRGFVCPRCSVGKIFPCAPGSTSAVEGRELAGAACEGCRHELSDAEAQRNLQEEKWLQNRIKDWESRSDREGHKARFASMVEDEISRAQRTLSQHYLCDRAWQVLADLYQKVEKKREAEGLMRRRVEFQESAYPGLIGTRAWTLESFGDMLVKHHGGALDPRVELQSREQAQALAPVAPGIYAESCSILSMMFGETHEYSTSVSRKMNELQRELDRLLDSGWEAASGGR